MPIWSVAHYTCIFAISRRIEKMEVFWHDVELIVCDAATLGLVGLLTPCLLCLLCLLHLHELLPQLSGQTTAPS